MRHLTLIYRRALVLVTATNWLFSVAMGAWQGSVHHAGPSTRSAPWGDITHQMMTVSQVRGGQPGVHALWRRRECGQVKIHTICGFINSNHFLDKLSTNYSSNFHFSPSDCDDRHQLLHLSQARDEGDGQWGGLRRLQTGGQGSPGLQHGQERESQLWQNRQDENRQDDGNHCLLLCCLSGIYLHTQSNGDDIL